jgi:hypothetical protein
MERVVIYPKDVHIVTGKSERWARNIIKEIKQTLRKQEHQLVSVDEFCSYMGLDNTQVKQQLQRYLAVN